MLVLAFALVVCFVCCRIEKFRFAFYKARKIGIAARDGICFRFVVPFDALLFLLNLQASGLIHLQIVSIV